MIAPTSSSGRLYTSIDGLRGIGVLMVLLLHTTGYSGLPVLDGQPLLARLAVHGHYGVEVFYVVSAYTLTFSLFAAVRRDQPNIVGTFWNRRVNRIVPTFLAVVAVAWFLKGWLSAEWAGADGFWSTLWRYASMTYIFDREVLRAAFGHSVLWSISTEFQFYLLMPVLLLPLVHALVRRPRSHREMVGLAAVIAVGSVLATAWSRTLLAGTPWLSYTLFYHFDAFAIGIAVALFVLAARDNPTPQTVQAPVLEPLPVPRKLAWIPARRVAPELVATGALLAVVLAVAASGPGGRLLDAIFATDAMRPGRLWVLLVCAGAIWVAQRAETKGATLSHLAPLRTVGLLSFIIYLVHVPVLQIVGKWQLPGVAGTAGDRYLATLSLGFVVSLAVAVLFHRLIEHPSLRLNRLAQAHPWMRVVSTLFVLVVAGSLLAYAARG